VHKTYKMSRLGTASSGKLNSSNFHSSVYTYITVGSMQSVLFDADDCKLGLKNGNRVICHQTSCLVHTYGISLDCWSCQSLVPVQWKRSCITPVPKIAHPVECKDFRPISVTSVLSRVMERLIVRSDLYPVLVHPEIFTSV